MRTALLLAALAAIVSAALTGVVRRYAIARSLVDHPNARSSHDRPTPRGGGLALAAVILGGTASLTLAGWIDVAAGIGIAGGGLAVAAVGWLDDHSSLPPTVRAGVHLLAALWAVTWLGGLPALRVGQGAIALGASGTVLGVLAVAWAINFYNFMDGIDGLAAGQAVLVAGLGAGFLLGDGVGGLGMVAALTLGASAGFLAWNWAPARIFMGDVGSGLLGFVFGALAVGSEQQGSLPALGWLLLLGTFFLDATLTLVRRMLAGERWFEAHRSHAYQRAVQSGWSHRRVTSVMLLCTALLGLPAWGVWRGAITPGAALGAGLLLLTAVYLAVERRRPMARGPGG